MLYMKKLLSILSLAILCIFAAQAQDTDLTINDYNAPKTYEIGGITITGTKYLNEEVLIKYSGLNVGQKIKLPGEEIPKAIKALWKQGLFEDVKIYADKIINDVIFLNIKLEERIRLSKYTFKGVKKVEEDDLREQLDLIRGRLIDENLISNTKNSILEYYKDKGFLNSFVDIIQTEDKQFTNSNILTIRVSRGNKIKVNEIIFKGNESVFSRKLKKQMETKERTSVKLDAPKTVYNDLKKMKIGHTLGNLSVIEAAQYIEENVVRFKPFSSSKFIDEEFDLDKGKIIDYYNELGYRDARIVNDTMYLANEKSINVELDIEEGQQYYFRNIEWKGNSKYESEKLSQILGIERGDIYNQSLLQARLFMDPNGNDVSSLYMDDGYLFFNVNPAEKTVEDDSIDLVINVYEGPQATIDEVRISGNTKTNEHVVRRAIRSLPGSKFSRSDIIRSQREIASLGFFDPEQIQINPIPNPQKGTVDIEYKVVEKPSDQLELSAGWGGNTIVGSLGVSFNNFSIQNIFNPAAWRPLPVGDGQRLSVRFQSTGQAFQSLNASFTEPWLGGKRPNALSISGYTSRSARRSILQNTAGNDSTVNQSLFISGASIGLGRRLEVPDDNFVLNASLNYQRYNLRHWNTDFIFNNGKANNLNLNITLSRYSLDQPIYPRSGSNISLSGEFTPPFSTIFNPERDYSKIDDASEKYKWVEYHKWKFKAEWYTSIVGKLVLKTSAKLGGMGYYNQDIGHSPFERFEMGGDGISNFNLFGKDIIALRGYEENEVPSRAVDAQAARGGYPFFAKYTVELRYPLSLNPSATIYALAFAEGGNTWENFNKFNPFEVQRSTGLGIRFFLPMFGTLGFDYGIGFDKLPGTGNRFGDLLANKARFSVILGVEPE